jgi:hypothetical protein
MTKHSHRRIAILALLAATLAGLVAAATALAAPPAETAQPNLDGNFRRGSTITTSNGSWSNNPTSYNYRWQRCDANGNAATTASLQAMSVAPCERSSRLATPTAPARRTRSRAR